MDDPSQQEVMGSAHLSGAQMDHSVNKSHLAVGQNSQHMGNVQPGGTQAMQMVGNELDPIVQGVPGSAVGTSSGPQSAAKRKEIYRYEAPFILYATSWSQHPDPSKKFRLASASFIEEYNNKVSIVQLDEEAGEFIHRGTFDHPYPATKVMWIPDQKGVYPDMVATSGDYLRLWRVGGENGARIEILLNNNRSSEYCAPLTSFDWNDVDVSLIGTSSIDTTCTIWQIEKGVYPDMVATSGDYLRLWRVGGENGARIEILLNNNRSSEYCAPLTSFDWNDVDVSLIGTSSIDTTCTIWQIETGQAIGTTCRATEGSVKTQLIAHDKEVFDIAFSRLGNGREVFASVGADGSVRMFDLRHLEHSTIIFEEPNRVPLLRLACNKQDHNYIATFAQDSNEVIILDVRIPCTPVAKLNNHRATVNGMAWAPHSSCHICTADVRIPCTPVAKLNNHRATVNGMAWAPHSSCHICTAGDDNQALIWDIHSMPRPVDDPILAYQAGGEVNQVHWAAAFPDWISICYNQWLEILRV
ncbi:DDB1- and CUL4-associated factor 7 [Toxocara canis]|uniref:DDB1-and CUL4-associated factor 7 n=1 Tax=Toxocara canis TaxID=6265 RepID=A0A0B2VH65_TOXCA|nr:DDB1- and CUL4-associated factor 7 [Toxocara canis]